MAHPLSRSEAGTGIAVKICGLSTEETVEAAVAYGATHVGFVFHPRSPRAVTPSRAADLMRFVRGSVMACGLFVDADDEAIERTLERVPLDLIQLHGDESPERCARLRERLRRPILRAFGIATADDLRRAGRWIDSVDSLLLDAKPPPGPASLPGGNGVAFDWTLLSGYAPPLPWFLSGGLGPANVAEALKRTHAPGVDVSSGVETSPGVKDIGLIRTFLAAARAAG